MQERSSPAHGVHLTDSEFQRLSKAGSAIAFCPTSNLFLGSGLFNINRAKLTDYPIKVGLGTDIGGGTSLSLLQTANEAYKVTQLQQQNLSSFKALFLATLGGAQALHLDDTLGNFDIGKEADFIVLDHRATPLMAYRHAFHIPESLKELADYAFSLMMMGDDRSVQATYTLGEIVYQRD